MRVALQRCPAPVFRSERGEELDLLLAEGAAGRVGAAAVTGLDELQGYDGGLGGDCGELEQSIGGFQAAVFELKAFGLDEPEELLDCPAFLVPSNDPLGRGGVGDLVGRQKAPMQRLGVGWRKILDDLDQGQIDALGQGGRRALRSLDSHASKAQRKLGLTGRLMGASRKIDRRHVGDRQSGARRIKARAIDQGAVMHRTRQKMKVLRRNRSPFGVNVAFAIVDYGDASGRLKHLFGSLGGAELAPRFPLLKRPLGVRNRDPARPRADLSGHQAKASVAVGVERQHGVQQHAAPAALADLAQTAPPLGCRLEVDLAGVLDRQNMQAAAANRVCSLQPASRASNVTFSLAKKRP